MSGLFSERRFEGAKWQGLKIGVPQSAITDL
jgi:hypothetical protein